jgi:hypothetical protein
MNKLLIMAAAITVSTSSVSQVEVSGEYEGTLTQGGVYSQTLDLKLVGATPLGSVTAIVDENQVLTDLYTTAKLYGIDVTLGNMTIDDVANTSIIKASTTVGGMTVGVSKTSGGNESLDVSGSSNGMDVSIENLTRSDREVTLGTTIQGVASTAVYQKTTAGTILDMDLSTKVDGLTLEYEYDRAADDSSSNGGYISVPLGLTTVKSGVSVASTDVKTYLLEVSHGILTGKWEKVGEASGVVSAIASIDF